MSTGFRQSVARISLLSQACIPCKHTQRYRKLPAWQGHLPSHGSQRASMLLEGLSVLPDW